MHQKRLNSLIAITFFLLVWNKAVKGWKAWREARLKADEAKVAAVVEARMASAKKAEEGLYPDLAGSGLAASAPSGDGE